MAEDKKNTTYLAWLRDAHAMELALITALEKQAKDAEGKPVFQKRIKQHIEETKGHAAMIEECIKRNGGDTSTVKDLMGKASAAMSGVGMSMMQDLMVKNMHSAYAAEHFEIASYTVIQAAADELGDYQTSQICDDILNDEYNMADWVKEHIPDVVEEHLRKLEDA